MLTVFKSFYRLWRVSFLRGASGSRASTEPERLDDHQLMINFSKHGSSKAFEVLLKRYRTQLYGYLVNSCKNQALAEDLYQETFLRIIKAASRYKKRASFRTWLFSIARHLLIDHYRKLKKEVIPKQIKSNESPFEESIKDNRFNPEQLDQKDRIRCCIAEALAELPEEQREIFLLREHAGLSFQEAASVAGCQLSTAKSRMRYAILKIREKLENSELTPQKVMYE